MERKLRILWITLGGSWIIPLLNQLKNDVLIEVVIPTQGRTEDRIENNVLFHYMHMPINKCMCDMTEGLSKYYLNIIENFNPDLIHIHGTEHNFGQLYKYCQNRPIVISMQGILTESYPVSTNGLTKADVKPFCTLKNCLGRGGLFSMEKRWRHGSESYELDIIHNNKFFFCRTNWDVAFVKKHNPQAHIFNGEELLRPAFYQNAGKWNVDKCIHQRIFSTAGFNPIKGLHHAINALAAIKKKWPKAQMVIPGTQMHVFAYRGLKQRLIGEEYVGYCNSLIDRLYVRDCIQFLPYLDDKQMAEQLLQANVFLAATSVDNSPNALGEAMMLGVPSVITPVGGVPSIIEHEKNGLLSTIDQLTDNIDKLFQNKEFASSISRNAYKTALLRHNCEAARQQYLSAYKYIVTNQVE